MLIQILTLTLNTQTAATGIVVLIPLNTDNTSTTDTAATDTTY